MPTTYLFRIDMNKDNNAFFNARKSSANYVYAELRWESVRHQIGFQT